MVNNIQARQLINCLCNKGKLRKDLLSSLRHSKSILDPHLITFYPIMFNILDDRQLSRDGKPTKAENAMFLTAKLFAVLTQGNNNLYESANKIFLFKALSTIRVGDTTSIDRRFNNLLKSISSYAYVQQTLPELAHILKGKKKDLNPLCIDYEQLYSDLQKLQDSFEASRQVGISWGQDFYSFNSANKENNNE